MPINTHKMNYIVVDLEATCWNPRGPRPNEIIEIGAVCVDENQQIVGEFEQFVQPKIHPQLSEFCTELTSITQEMVDSAPTFPEVLELFQNWIKNFGEDYLLCSWGHYDRVQFKNDCELHNISTKWLGSHISIKHQHGNIIHARRPMGMKAALRKEGLKLDGTHHRGIDDARNIAKIFLKYFDNWERP